MTLAFDIRRAWTLALALLIVVAVVGPACLLFASTAFAMPSHEMPVSGCEDDGNGDMSACPHDDATRGDQAPAPAPVVLDAPAEVSLVTEPDSASVTLAEALVPDALSAPVAYLTPLRL